MTSSFVKVNVFADSQGFRLFFPIVENGFTQMYIQLVREVNTRVYFY